MKIRSCLGLAAAALLALGFGATGAGAGILPLGVQIGVDKTTVQNGWGWSECFSTAGNSSGASISGILSACDGDYLMLAAYESGRDDYSILAAAARVDVTFDTGVQGSNGTGIDTTHTANGAEWYFSGSWSWGFTDLGNVARLHSCDLALSPSFENNVGMCWHTGGGNLEIGWALNDGTFDFLDSSYTRVVLSLDELTTVSEPGALGALALGLAGLGFARRRRAA